MSFKNVMTLRGHSNPLDMALFDRLHTRFTVFHCNNGHILDRFRDKRECEI